MNFSPEVETLLRAAGWYPERRYYDWERIEGYTLFPLAEQILNEFAGLFVYSDGAGRKRARSSIKFIPKKVGYRDDIIEKYPDLTLYPIGEIYCGLVFFIDSNGRFHTYDDVGLRGLVTFESTFERTLEKILLGDRDNDSWT
jgi:hypothetical protein